MRRYTVQNLIEQMQSFVDEAYMPGAAVIINRGNEELYRGTWGYSDPIHKRPFTFDTLVRLASMSKPVTAIAIMQLEEQGKLTLDTSICEYIPGFSEPKMFAKYIWPIDHYESDKDFPAGMPVEEAIAKGLNMPLLRVPREITIRDLLSHSSGLGQGRIGEAFYRKLISPQDNLTDRVKKLEKLPLDFAPGTDTGYSSFAGFDVLGKVVELISQMDLETYFRTKIFEPLGITDICFKRSPEQILRSGEKYFSDNGKLYTGTDIVFAPTNELLDAEMYTDKGGYYSGSAGLWGTVEDYNKITRMLANGGVLNGVHILNFDTVKKMHSPAMKTPMEPAAVAQDGCVWGLGMGIFLDASKMGTRAVPGTYGWSGAYGTYFLIEPESKLSFTLTTSVTNCGGNRAPVSMKLQEMVFDIW